MDCEACAEQLFTVHRRRLRDESAPVAPLPRDRVKETTPFDIVGVDFCGTLYCHTQPPYDSRVYIAVFSCAVTRAVHLEFTSDLTAQAFLLAFQRFFARRGILGTVYSDNARAFHSCARQLRLLSSEDVINYASSQCIHWKFIAEHASWWGGFWERVIRTIKDALKRCLGCSCLTYEELRTILV